MPASFVFSAKTYSLPVFQDMVPRAIQALPSRLARCQMALSWFPWPKRGTELPTFPWGYVAHSSQLSISIKDQLCHILPTFRPLSINNILTAPQANASATST